MLARLKKLLKFKYFLYASVVAVLVYLYRQDFLSLDDVGRVPLPAATGSLGLLCAGLALQAKAWHATLRTGGARVSLSASFTSLFLSVFGKYIPGKVALVHGVTAYLHKYADLKRTRSGVLFAQYNLAYLVSGFAVGLLAVPFLSDRFQQYGLIAVPVVLASLLGYPYALRFGLRLYKRLTGKSAAISPDNVRISYAPVGWFLLSWLCVGLGFTLLLGGFTDKPSLATAFYYPLATSVSNLAIFTPGGIGVREGMLVWMLKPLLTAGQATTLATLSRLWFLTGEMAAFLAAVAWNKAIASRSTSLAYREKPKQ